MTKFSSLRLRTWICLRDDNNKKDKGTKKCVIKRKHKFEYYKSCLETNQLEKEINHPEKNIFDTDGLKENHKESIRKNRLILTSQQRFRSKKHNVFTEDVRRCQEYCIEC